MTTNQLRLQENLLRQKELAETQRANLAREAETNRSNLAKEAETYRSNIEREDLTNRENLAKYGSIDYATGRGTLEGENNSWKVLKTASDIFGFLFNPITAILGGKKK